MGAAGAVATLLNTVAKWVLSEDGLAEAKKRWALSSKKADALASLKNNDWSALRQHVAELERMSNKP